MNRVAKWLFFESGCFFVGFLLVCASTLFGLDVTTKSGTTYTDVTVTAVDPDGLRVTHTSGTTKLAFEDLPVEIQKQYQYDSKKATAYQRHREDQKTKAADLVKQRQERLAAAAAEVKRPDGATAQALKDQEKQQSKKRNTKTPPILLIYMIVVFLALTIWSASSAVTRKGARAEILALGAPNVGIVTHKIANGTATLGAKIGVVLATILGSFMSPLSIAVSALLGGLLFLIFHIWLGWTR
jgi:hypothetical protein